VGGRARAAAGGSGALAVGDMGLVVGRVEVLAIPAAVFPSMLLAVHLVQEQKGNTSNERAYVGKMMV
jgi:hypothetical protein